MSYLQTYVFDLAPDESGGRELRLNGVTPDEARAMASGLAGLYGRPCTLTIVRDASKVELIPPPAPATTP